MDWDKQKNVTKPEQWSWRLNQIWSNQIYTQEEFDDTKGK